MNSQEFAKWARAYRRQMLRPNEPCDFVADWVHSLSRFSLEIAMEALKRLVEDPRISEQGSPAAFPQKQLPLILEHAKAITEARERATRKPIVWGEKPPTTEAWDAGLMRRGVITKQEFAKRKRERESAK